MHIVAVYHQGMIGILSPFILSSSSFLQVVPPSTAYMIAAVAL